MKTLNQIRAETMERSRAFSEVIALRGKLADAQNRLAAVEADLVARPRQPPTTATESATMLPDLIKRLAEAEVYCLQVNPDQLREHDAKLAAAEQVAKAVREAQEAAHEIALEKGRKAAAVAGQARLEAPVALD